MEVSLTARALKATLVLDASAVAGIKVPDGTPKVTLRISLPDRTITAPVNSKSLRKVLATIAANGPENVAVVLSGKLEGAVLMEAGIAGSPKTKPE